MWENGNIEILPDELEHHNFILDFTKAKNEEDVLYEFVRSFSFDPDNTKNFADVWHELIQALFIRVSFVHVYGLENLKNIGSSYVTTMDILNGVKNSWNKKYSDRFVITIF